MTRLSIQLSDDDRAKLAARAADAGHASVEQYIEAIVRADADSIAPATLTFRNKGELQTMLLRGMNSGPAREVTGAEWAEQKRQLVARHASRRGA